MITLSETYPRIIAVVDWECSTAFPTSFFAQYPLFIVDHPLRIGNVRDRSVFNKLIPEAERKVDLDSGQPLSQAFANSLGPYLFEQWRQDHIIYSELYPQLFKFVFLEMKRTFLGVSITGR